MRRLQPYYLAMPSPFEHLSLAASIADKLPLSGSGRTAFLTGSLCPDVDKIAGFPRSTTHWWVPGDEVSGAIKLIAGSTRIRALPYESPERAFIAGYLCHLVADEQWTLTIYRPFFGIRSTFMAGQAGADRQWALQSSIDERHLATGSLSSALADVATAGDLCNWEGLIPTIPRGYAVRFVQMILRQAEMPDAASRYRFAETVSRELSNGPRLETDFTRTRPSDNKRPIVARPTSDSTRLEDFLSRLEALTLEAGRYVPEDAIAAYRERAEEESMKVCAAYLAGAPVMPPAGTAAPSATGASPARTDL